MGLIFPTNGWKCEPDMARQDGQKRGWSRRTVLLLLVAALAGGAIYAYRAGLVTPSDIAGLFGGGSGGGAPGQTPGRPGKPGQRPPTPVTVADVTLNEFYERLEALGTARADESVDITAQVTERVSRIAFEDSSLVQAGDILVELVSAEDEADLAQARATLREASQSYDRAADLLKQGNAPQSRLDTALAGRDVARARVEAIEARLAQRIIRAPFTGLVGLRQVSPGSLVRPGELITTLDDISVIKVDFPIPERFFAVMVPGLPIEVHAAAFPTRVFTGTVTAIDTRVDQRSRTIPVRAEIANGDSALRPGMLMSIDILSEPRTALSVPEGALVPFGERVYVYRLNAEERVARVEVATGRRRPGLVEILSGLSEGDRVVVEGSNLVRDGGQVRVIVPGAGQGGRGGPGDASGSQALPDSGPAKPPTASSEGRPS